MIAELGHFALVLALVLAKLLLVLLVLPRTKVSNHPSFLDNCLPVRYLRVPTSTSEELM